MPLPQSHQTLAKLLAGLSFHVVQKTTESSLESKQISTLSADSRLVVPEALFFAMPGVTNDGHSYLEKAVTSGCAAVVCEKDRVPRERLLALNVPAVEVADVSLAYAAVSANYFNRPAEKLHFIGVTGTNGKTTITYLVEHVFRKAGKSIGVIGTVNNRYTLENGCSKTFSTRFTTPEAFLLQQLFREMVDAGVAHVVMEVSSHALAQARIGSIRFDVAAFTNLTRDHLDYHSGMEDYFQAKARLFSEYLDTEGVAVLPIPEKGAPESHWLQSLEKICKSAGIKTVGWGTSEKSDIRLLHFTSTLDHTDLTVEMAGGVHRFQSPLVGRFNVDNILTTIGICRSVGIAENHIISTLGTAMGAPGRLEKVTTSGHWNSQGPLVLVDYAHTPDALEKVLNSVRLLPHRQLFCVFGCGGDRDKGKRPLMGKIAGTICDVVVVTDDNPRTEDPNVIVEQVAEGLVSCFGAIQGPECLKERGGEGRGWTIIRDRQKAIAETIRAAQAEDIVVIAGKGHERYQLTISGKRFFDDCLEAKNVLLSWTDSLLANALTNGSLCQAHNTDRLLGEVFTDSRIITPNGIFVALRGENYDAHDFVQQAKDNGASCVVVEHAASSINALNVTCIVVPDTVQALGDLAAFRRRKLSLVADQTVIGITGSCGKTTVKEMVAAIMMRMWPGSPDYPDDAVLKTRGNYNNLIGLPLSLLPLAAHHRAAVMEMGMNRPGEITRLAQIADPDISCITNIHGAHLEGLGSIEGVAKAKEELFAATKQTGTLVVNLDDDWVVKVAGKYAHKKVTFAVSNNNRYGQPDFWATSTFFEPSGAITFTMHHHEQSAQVHLFTAGAHNVNNALAAAAICSVAGAGWEEIVAGLADFRSQAKRMEILKMRSGVSLLNDSYNANPGSMAAGLRTLKQLAGRFSVAIIGDMRELGDSSRQAHSAIGKLIAELAIDWVGVVGDFKEDVQQGALDQGLTSTRIRMFAVKEDAVAWIKELIDIKKLGKDDLILVKASRGLKFETIVADLIAGDN